MTQMLELADKPLKTIIINIFKHYKSKDGYNERADGRNHSRKKENYEKYPIKTYRTEKKLISFSKWKPPDELNSTLEIIEYSISELEDRSIETINTEQRVGEKRLKNWIKLQ